MTSYYLAFSNDSREWTTIHDGFADWVSGIQLTATSEVSYVRHQKVSVSLSFAAVFCKQ